MCALLFEESEINMIDNRQYIITKEKPYFIVPMNPSMEFVEFTRFSPDLFNPMDDLHITLKKELKDSAEFTTPLSLIDFIDQNVGIRKTISLRNNDNEPYLMVSLLLGKKDHSGRFVEVVRLDPTNLGDFKITLEYKFSRQVVPQ